MKEMPPAPRKAVKETSGTRRMAEETAPSTNEGETG